MPGFHQHERQERATVKVRMTVVMAGPNMVAIESPWVETTGERADAVERLATEQLKASPPSGVLTINWGEGRCTYIPVPQVAYVTFERGEL